MNEDDFKRMLSATPDEPDLPADRVELVHRRSRMIKARRRGTAGALAVALVAAVAGTALAIPGSHDNGGPSRLRVATSPTTGNPPTPFSTPTASGSTTPVGAGTVRALPFTWTVHVSGQQVTVGGSWSGTAPTLSAADLAHDTSPSTFAQAGSGVLGLSGYLSNADGTAITAADAADLPDGTVYESNGDIPACTGPVTAQHRTVSPKTITVTRSGSYRLTMHSYTCAGERSDTVTITVGSTGETFAWATHTYGEWVEVTGSWSGVSTAAANRSATLLSPADLVSTYSLSNPGAVTFTGNNAADGGLGFMCGGPAIRHTAAFPTVWYRFARPGTYRLSLTSRTCGGEVDSTTTLTAGGGDPFTAAIPGAPTTATTGVPYPVTADFGSPLSPAYEAVFAVSPAGTIVPIGQTAGNVSNCVSAKPDAGDLSGTVTFDRPGTWSIYAVVGCSDDTAFLHGTFRPGEENATTEALGDLVTTVAVSGTATSP